MSQFENQVSNDRRIMGIPVIGNPSALTPSLQFDATQNAFVWVVGGGSVSELEFLQEKDAAGKLRNVTGSRAAVGAAITITPPLNTTTVIYKCNISKAAGGAADIISLIMDGVTIETNELTDGGSWGEVTFITKGKQLIGDGVKTIVMNIDSGSAAAKKCNVEAYDL